MFGPITLSFSDIGPIPPPRMFSDPTHSLVMHIVNSLENHDLNCQDDDDECSHTQPKTTIPVCIIKSADGSADSFTNPIIEDEVPAKEPQLSAVPKKSALKKPRIAAVAQTIIDSLQNPPSYSSCTSAQRPQASPRYNFNSAMPAGPIQLLQVTSQSSPLSNHNRTQM